MEIKIPSRLLCLWLALWLPVGAAAPLESAGRVVFSRGGALVIGEIDSRNVAYGSSVYTGDRIVTSRGARLAVRLHGGTLILLGADTEFVLRSYDVVRVDRKVSAVFELLKGAFRAVTAQLYRAQGASFTVRTPVATIGVRGTDFWGGFHFSEALDVALLDGKGVYVENDAGRVEITTVGHGTTVTNATTAPRAPRAWPAEKVKRAQAATSLATLPAR